jgi:hypothetical protein
MKALKVFIKEYNCFGYVHYIQSIEKDKKYYVRYKSNLGTYVGAEFKGNELSLC